MISRWEDVAVRVADRLNMPVQDVIYYITEMAERTRSHAIHPKVMETDLFGLGYLQARYGKLQQAISKLKYVKAHRTKYRDKAAEAAMPELLEKWQKKLDQTDLDIETFAKFIDIKEAMYKAGGKVVYIKNVLPTLNLSLPTSKPKINVSGVKVSYQGPKKKLSSQKDDATSEDP